MSFIIKFVVIETVLLTFFALLFTLTCWALLKSAWKANLERFLTSLITGIDLIFSESCSMKIDLRISSLTCPGTKLRSRCKKTEGFSSPRVVLSPKELYVRFFNFKYLLFSRGQIKMSSTKGRIVWSRYMITCLNFDSSLTILLIAKATSTYINQRVGFSFQKEVNVPFELLRYSHHLNQFD